MQRQVGILKRQCLGAVQHRILVAREKRVPYVGVWIGLADLIKIGLVDTSRKSADQEVIQGCLRALMCPRSVGFSRLNWQRTALGKMPGKRVMIDLIWFFEGRHRQTMPYPQTQKRPIAAHGATLDAVAALRLGKACAAVMNIVFPLL